MNPDERFEPWNPDEHGRLWSDVLGLYLTTHGDLVQAQTGDGRILLTPEQEAEARKRAEVEVERLREELERRRRETS